MPAGRERSATGQQLTSLHSIRPSKLPQSEPVECPREPPGPQQLVDHRVKTCRIDLSLSLPVLLPLPQWVPSKATAFPNAMSSTRAISRLVRHSAKNLHSLRK